MKTDRWPAAGLPLMLTVASISQTGGAISAGKLTGSAAAAAAFNQSGNAIGTLGPFSAGGSFALADTVGTLNLAGAISANSLTVSDAGGVTLANGATVIAAGTVVLAATGAFVNDAGANAVTAGSRWLIYSANPGGDTFGPSNGTFLNSNQTAIFDQTYASLPPGSVSQTGNRYIFANQPVLTVSPVNEGKVYGTAIDLSGDYAIAGYQGVAGAFATDTAQTAMIMGAPVITSAGSGVGAPAGTDPIMLTTGTLASGSGYRFTAGTNATLTVSQAPLTITALNQGKVYGQTATLGTTAFSTQGLVTNNGNNDSVTAVALASTGAQGSANAGTDSINASNAQGSGLSNYAITYVAGQLVVAQAPLTVTGAKTYDATTGFATSQLAVAGAVNGESVSLTSGTGTSSSADAGSYAGSPLSNLAISVSGGNMRASNCALPGTGTLTIGKATISVAGASGVDKTYDGTTALSTGATGFVYTGVVGSNATVSAGSAQYASANAGTGPINVGGLTISGAAAADYVLSATGVTGSGTIAPAPVVVTANRGSSIYGNVPTNPGLSATGLVVGQTIDALTGLGSSFALTSLSNAGQYALAVTGTNGNGNYRVVGTMGGTYSIDPRPLTLTAADEARLLGQPNPPLAYQIGGQGLVNGDALTGTLATAATRASPVGSYAITQGTLAATANYAVSYVPGTLVIAPSLPPAATGLGSRRNGPSATTSRSRPSCRSPHPSWSTRRSASGYREACRRCCRRPHRRSSRG